MTRYAARPYWIPGTSPLLSGLALDEVQVHLLGVDWRRLEWGGQAIDWASMQNMMPQFGRSFGSFEKIFQSKKASGSLRQASYNDDQRQRPMQANLTDLRQGFRLAFVKDQTEKSEITPLEAWGSLLSVTGKAKLGPDGPSMEFSKGQAKKIAKDSN